MQEKTSYYKQNKHCLPQVVQDMASLEACHEGAYLDNLGEPFYRFVVKLHATAHNAGTMVLHSNGDS